jgi:anti-anti-sigma factor
MNSQACLFDVYQLDAELLVKCEGWLRLHNVEIVKTQVLTLLQRPIGKFYLHVAGLHEIDSAGLGVIVGLHVTMRKQKVEFFLLCPTGHQMRLLETTRLTSFLKVMTGLEAEMTCQRLEKPEQRVALPWETVS